MIVEGGEEGGRGEEEGEQGSALLETFFAQLPLVMKVGETVITLLEEHWHQSSYTPSVCPTDAHLVSNHTSHGLHQTGWLQAHWQTVSYLLWRNHSWSSIYCRSHSSSRYLRSVIGRYVPEVAAVPHSSCLLLHHTASWL